ncbi:MAG: hypothetical protein PHQ75_02965 [Thermoguttaceae bacterium]|nr:hypothetical protein [Thermoguttaceae bacterium]
MAKQEDGWLEWDLETFRIFLKGISGASKFQSTVDKLAADNPEAFQRVKFEYNQLHAGDTIEGAKRIADIRARIDRENYRLAYLRDDLRDEEFRS